MPSRQLLTYRFGSDSRFEGQLVGALERIESGGAMRVLDALFVARAPETGDLTAVASVPTDRAESSASCWVSASMSASARPRPIAPDRRQRRGRTGARGSTCARQRGRRRDRAARMGGDAGGRGRPDRRHRGRQRVRRRGTGERTGGPARDGGRADGLALRHRVGRGARPRAAIRASPPAASRRRPRCACRRPGARVRRGRPQTHGRSPAPP